MRACRALTRAGLLSARTAIVVLPTALTASSLGPSQRKCSGQRSVRGLKSRVSWPVSGSRPAMLGPLYRLHRPQHRARFPRAVRPPCWRAITWSTTCLSVEAACGNRQYSQRSPARRQTSCSRTLSMPVLRCRISVSQRSRGLGFYDSEKVVDIEVFLELGALGVAQGSLTGFGRKLLIARMVCRREVKGEEMARQFGRQAGPLRFDHALKNGGVARHGFNMDEAFPWSIPNVMLVP